MAVQSAAHSVRSGSSSAQAEDSKSSTSRAQSSRGLKRLEEGVVVKVEDEGLSRWTVGFEAERVSTVNRGGLGSETIGVGGVEGRDGHWIVG